jgi:glycerate-2-kinase
LLSDGPGLPRAGQRLFVLANNQQAVNAAALRATELGYRFKSWTVAKSRNADGEGRDLYLMLAKCRAGNVCLVCGGEPTVLLAPPEIRGNGGRNQQLILSALQTARNSPPVPGDWCLLSAGTDGQDGVSAAAGAWIDPAVISRVTALGLDGARALAVNDAGSFFDRAGALFFCDATGTNVCDLRVAIRRNG